MIYLEDPRHALPARDNPQAQNWFEAAPGQDPLAVADGLGRPVAILRLGGKAAGSGHGSPPSSSDRRRLWPVRRSRLAATDATAMPRTKASRPPLAARDRPRVPKVRNLPPPPDQAAAAPDSEARRVTGEGWRSGAHAAIIDHQTSSVIPSSNACPVGPIRGRWP